MSIGASQAYDAGIRRKSPRSLNITFRYLLLLSLSPSFTPAPFLAFLSLCAYTQLDYALSHSASLSSPSRLSLLSRCYLVPNRIVLCFSVVCPFFLLSCLSVLCYRCFPSPFPLPPFPCYLPLESSVSASWLFVLMTMLGILCGS
jgi:hypothetical protein